MPFTKEQTETIKQQLLLQVDKLPQENKEEIKQYISQLNEQQLEDFLKQNKIQLQQPGQPQQQLTQQQGVTEGTEPLATEPQEPQCIFCSIIKNEMPSYKIAENKKAIAILEINPLSKGHSLILPIEHTTIEKIPRQALTLAQKITKKIKTKLKPEDVKIETSSFQGHAIINVIPFYKDVPPKKEKASEQELQKFQSKLETKKRATTTRKRKIKVSNLPEISFRIP